MAKFRYVTYLSQTNPVKTWELWIDRQKQLGDISADSQFTTAITEHFGSISIGKAIFQDNAKRPFLT